MMNFRVPKSVGNGENGGSIGLGIDGINPQNPRSNFGVLAEEPLLVWVEGKEELGFWVHGAWDGGWLLDGFGWRVVVGWVCELELKGGGHGGMGKERDRETETEIEREKCNGWIKWAIKIEFMYYLDE
ncbi:unnamed protein product [Prunus armeniaca]|uniref:Uncharacterized protein n=1 Tax=Prunus armeniaca TaxID=36596 RepID=A0A6J5W002_PRUAR|nr:unnamed protein product [Prunus armeniaca]